MHIQFRRNLLAWRTHASRHALALLTITALVLIAFPFWFSHGGLGFDDLTRLNAPQRMVVAWMYRHGHMPFWNPYSFAGQPLWAAGQAGPFYLPNIVYVFLPVVTALKASYLFHELLAAWGMYAVVWQFCRSRLGAVVGAVSFVTCGFMIGHQIHTQMYDAMSWFPLIFWAFLRLLDRVTAWRMCILGAALATEVYAGHPQVTFYIVLALFLYSALHAVQNLRSRQMYRGTAASWISVIIGVLLSAPQWLTTLDFISYSNRADASSWFLLQGSMPLQGPLQWLSPFVFGGGYSGEPISEKSSLMFYHSILFWEFTAYMGVIALALAIGITIHAWRRQEAVRNLFVMTVIMLNLSMGENGMLSSILTTAPGFDLFRIPGRYIGLADFCLAALAGIAVSHLLGSEKSARIRLQRWVGAAAFLFVVVLVVCRALGPLRDTPPRTFWVPLVICLLVMLVCWLHVSRTRWFTAVYLACLALLDCTSQAASLSGFIVVSRPAYTHPTATTEYIKKHLNSDDPFARMIALDDTSLSYDQAAGFEIPAVNGYDSLEPRWYAEHVNMTWSPSTFLHQPRSILDALDVKYVLTSRKHTDLFPRETLGIETWMHWMPPTPASADGVLVDLSGAGVPTDTLAPVCAVTLTSGSHRLTHVIHAADTQALIPLPSDWPRHDATQIRIDNESWYITCKVTSVGFVHGMTPIHKSKLFVDKWFGPRGWTPVFEAGDEIVWENPDARDSAWLTSSTVTPLQHNLTGSVTKTSWSPDAQAWQVQGTTHGGYLVLSQMYDPHWRATVDGKPAEVKGVGQGFGDILTAIRVPAGIHDVKLVYIPGGLPMGAALASGGLASWLALCIFGLRKKQRRYTVPD